MPPSRVEVVHVGSACRDIAPDDPRGWRLGGGVSYGALTTACLGLRTAAVIGVDALAAEASELDLLRDAGVAVHLIGLGECPVFDNVETPTGRIQTALAVGRPLAPPADLPRAWRATRAWSFVPVAGEVDDRWADLIERDTLVALGWQGWLRRLTAGARVTPLAPRPSALLARADLVGVSEDDIAPGTSRLALAAFLDRDARLLVTDGPAGGWDVSRDAVGGTRTTRFGPAETRMAIDSTGAGDTFLGALLVATVRPELMGPGRRAGADLRFAAAAGSLAVEGVGLLGVPSLEAVWARAFGDDPQRWPGSRSRR